MADKPSDYEEGLNRELLQEFASQAGVSVDYLKATFDFETVPAFREELTELLGSQGDDCPVVTWVDLRSGHEPGPYDGLPPEEFARRMREAYSKQYPEVRAFWDQFESIEGARTGRWASGPQTPQDLYDESVREQQRQREQPQTKKAPHLRVVK